MRTKGHVLCRQVKDGAVLINLETNQIYDLNRTGFRIWQLLQEGSNRTAIQDRIIDEFDVDAASAVSEVETLLAHLTQENLLED